MKKTVRILSLLLAAALSVSLFSLPALAAETETPQEYNQKVAARAKELEEKYLITISYPVGNNGYAAIGTATMATLDTALGYVTPEVVRQVSAYYQEKNGKKLHFSYSYSNALNSGSKESILAGFDDRTSLIEVYIPNPGTNAILTGNSPTAIVHEFGHAFHLMYTAKYGHSAMRKEWTAMNEGISYADGNISRNPNEKVFASGYAATSFEEDFAETFAYAFVCNRAGLGLGSRLTDGSNRTSLGRKMSYLEQMIPRYLSNTDQALANMRRVYTTATTTSYQNVALSGTYLEFIGYNEPNRVFTAITDALNMNPKSSEWVREIGGWDVTDDQGNRFVLFPGGTWGRLNRMSVVRRSAA